jgi:hypothetical protein
MLVAGAGLFPARTAAGHETNSVTSRGEAAVGQLRQGVQDQGLRSALDQARYGIVRADSSPLGRWAWHAPNPAAGYDAYITEEGVTIVVGGEPCVSLSLRGFGYAPGLRAIAPGQVSGDGQTVNLTRDGSVQEWFVNNPEGLEQGFTFAEAPAGRRPGVPLTVALQDGEGEQATAGADGRTVTLRSADGSRVVGYGKLSARDRTGRDLPARLTAEGNQVFIEVEDGEAAYPLTIDPVFTLREKLTAEDTTLGDNYGVSVALQGDTAVVGAYNDDVGSNMGQGSVYVFTRDHGAWSFRQQLTASDGEAWDRFGDELALDGDTLVVGARDATDTNETYYRGAAYVFTRSEGVWTQQQKISAFDGASNDCFACSLAVSGDALAVGAMFDDIGPTQDRGSAYFYTRADGVWTFRQKLTCPNGLEDDYDSYGSAVALSEGTLVVGAYRANASFLGDDGIVYIYARGHAGWVLEKRLIAPDREFGDNFGYSVALDGETLAVGANRDDIDANPDQGSVYVFKRGGGAWPFEQKLTAGDGGPADNFGFAVALDGDTLVAGDFEDDFNSGNTEQGSAYVFTRGEGAWTQQQKLTAADGAAWDWFGQAVAVSGDTVLVGAPGDDVSEENYDVGSVYVFKLPNCPTLMFKPEVLPGGVSNVAYEQAVIISGGAGPYEFMQLAGSLPPGVSLSTDGVLSGTPTAAGTYHFMILATDTGSGCGSVHDYTLTVE